jgi:hypothetical protein
MNAAFSSPQRDFIAYPAARLRRCGFSAAMLCAFAIGYSGNSSAQITVNTKTGTVTNDSTGKATATVDRRYQQITPTSVALTKSELDPKTRLELIRVMQAEQGFAMRPLPRGHRGLTLVANGKLEPAGEAYVSLVTSEGLSAKPGDRVVITDVKVEHSKIVFDFNGGPDVRHRFLQHIQLGTGGMTTPVVQGNDAEPVGSRLTLSFQNHVPELTGKEVKALLAPLISFDVKTPVQAFTDTLPGKLKSAILNHQVLVGMSTDMVLFAKGQPETKTREMDGQMPFEEWIYGKAPQPVEFVRINGNRVIRLEVAKVGEPPIISTRDEVEGLMRTDGTPLEPDTTRVAKMGDVERDPNKQAPVAPPSLRNPGESLPQDQDKSSVGVMRPVQFPKPKTDTQQPDPQPGANPDGVPDTPATSSAPAATPSAGDSSQPSTPNPPAKPQMVFPAASSR